MFASFEDLVSEGVPGYLLAKLSYDGDVEWNVIFKQGFDSNWTSYWMPRVLLSPDKSYVTLRARTKPSDSSKSWESISLHDEDDGTIMKLYWYEFSDSGGEPAFSKIDISPNSNLLLI